MADHDYRQGGLRQKYIIQKVDGTPVNPDAVYFVLRLDKDPHARTAVLAYAESVRIENPELADDIVKMVRECRKRIIHEEALEIAEMRLRQAQQERGESDE